MATSTVNIGPSNIGPQMDMEELARRHAQSMNAADPNAESIFAPPGALPPGAGRDAAQPAAPSREPLPLRVPNQEAVLFHRAHTHLKCRNAHPAVRLLALVETMPPRQDGQSVTALPPAWSGTRIIREMQKYDLDIFMQPVFEPILVPRHQGALTLEQENEKIQSALQQNAEQIQANREAFNANMEDRKKGLEPEAATEAGTEAGTEAATEAATEAEPGTSQREEVADTPSA